MGRLPPLTAALVPLFALGAAACDDAPTAPAKARIDAVAASADPKASPRIPPPPSASSTVAKGPPRPPRALCNQQTERDPPAALDIARSAEGEKVLPTLRYGKRWVWLNVWAAWCEPCKDEMPMLLSWRDKLRRAGVEVELAFVSIDDDERELTRFLNKQPAGGVRASYWLPEEQPREAWFLSIGYPDEPTLPVHAFVNPSEKLACVFHGALEATDWAAVERLLGDR